MLEGYSAKLEVPFAVIGIRTRAERLTELEYLPLGAAALKPIDAFSREVCRQLKAYFKRSDFDHPVPAGFARGVWNFSLSEGLEGQTILQTETRVICGDSASRRKFLAYWFVVRPFSGLIRLIMLRNVRRAAEKGR